MTAITNSSPWLAKRVLTKSNHHYFVIISIACLVKIVTEAPVAFSFVLPGIPVFSGVILNRRRSEIHRVFSTSSSVDNDASSPQRPTYHNVAGIQCVEIRQNLNHKEGQLNGPITILEANAKSQDDLVNSALLLEEEAESTDQQQLLNAGDPYGAVLWPASITIANYLLDIINNDDNFDVKNVTILELGAGTGLVSITAAAAGAKKVISTDYEEIPLKLLRYAAENLNDRVNGINVGDVIETYKLDLCEYEHTPLPFADIVIAADVMYEPKTGRCVAHRTYEALRAGSRVLIGDSPGRPGRIDFLQELENLGIKNATFVDFDGTTCVGHRHDLICGEDSISISEFLPEKLNVAVMDLDPIHCFPSV